MRMDQSAGTTAADILADLRRGRPAPHLRALRRGEARRPLRPGHHRRPRRGADRPIRPPRRDPASRRRPYAAQRTGHPAKRVFQALRIEVNRELVGARARHPRRARHPAGRRPHRRAGLPVARGPASSSASSRDAVGLDRARGAAGRAARARAAVPAAGQGRRTRLRRGARDATRAPRRCACAPPSDCGRPR